MNVIEFLTILTCVAGLCIAIFKYRDTLHPLAFIMPMSAFMYFYLPTQPACRVMKDVCFSPAQNSFVEIYSLFSILFLVVGCCFGSKERRVEGRGIPGGRKQRVAKTKEGERITRVGVILGTVALAVFLINIYNQGGFIATYSAAKGSVGGAGLSSGYFRDPAFWAVAASLLLLLGAARSRNRTWHYIGVAVFITPLLLQGFLASRRGPTFMGIVSVVVGYYITHGKRPSAATLLLGGGTIGALLLFLVTFRGDIYLGSDLLSRISMESAREAVNEKLSKETTGNEAFYAANVIISSREKNRHYWGKRYATIIFIRPIPKQIWPTKYEDVGMEDYLVNVGLGTGDQLLIDVPPGAATGFAADLYVEFAWGGLIVCGLIGWYYGWSWRKLRDGDGFGVINYGCLAAFSIFLIAQSVEAILSRYLVVIVPTAILWRLFIYKNNNGPSREYRKTRDMLGKPSFQR
jgi:hypothetical protein